MIIAHVQHFPCIFLFWLVMQLEYKLEYTAYWDQVGRNVSKFNISAFSGDIQRQLSVLQYIGSAALKDIKTLIEVLRFFDPVSC